MRRLFAVLTICTALCPWPHSTGSASPLALADADLAQAWLDGWGDDEVTGAEASVSRTRR